MSFPPLPDDHVKILYEDPTVLISTDFSKPFEQET